MFGHSIDWKTTSLGFNNKKKMVNNKYILQMVESALLSKLPNFNLSSGSYSLPHNIVQDMVSELSIQ